MSLHHHIDELKVLLIDDDADDGELFRAVLYEVNRNFRFAWSPYSPQVMDILYAEQPHLVFLDVYMPLKSGLECLQQIKLNPLYKSIPVIMYSVSERVQDMEACWNAGAHHYLIKPYSHHNLHNSLQKVFRTDWREQTNHRQRKNFLIGLDYR